MSSKRVIMSLVFASCSSNAERVDDANAVPDIDAADAAVGQGTVRPLGTVDDLGVSSTCTVSGGTCHRIRVTCPGAEPIEATIAVIEPTGTLKGTIITHSGGGGTGMFGTSGGQYTVVSRYRSAGFRTASIAWSADWEMITTATPSIKVAACRPATAIKWVFDHIHAGRRDVGFCGQGNSGGAGVLSYALATYGISEYWDYAMITEGPPFGRLDCGCDGKAPGCAPVPPLCPQLPNPWLPLPSAVINEWEGISTCGTKPPAADLAKLFDDSVASSDAVVSYPKTVVSGWFCAQQPNGTSGGGAFYLSQIQPAAQVFCAPNCSGEDIYNPSAMLPNGTLVLDAMVEQMTTGCVPRHQ